jgi:AraC family transcriptional regulator, arabinose operon regulatory protein
MTVGLDADDGLGPLDGDVLAAGRTSWPPARPPNRPDMPGQRLLTFTISGRGVYTCGDVQISAERGDLVALFDDSPTTHEVPAGQPWDYFYVLFNPPDRLSLPTVFERVAPGLHRAHVPLESTRQRLQDAFARVVAEMARRDTSRALKALDDGPPVFVSDPSHGHNAGSW